jgi:hypothetical protein
MKEDTQFCRCSVTHFEILPEDRCPNAVNIRPSTLLQETFCHCNGTGKELIHYVHCDDDKNID